MYAINKRGEQHCLDFTGKCLKLNAVDNDSLFEHAHHCMHAVFLENSPAVDIRREARGLFSGKLPLS